MSSAKHKLPKSNRLNIWCPRHIPVSGFPNPHWDSANSTAAHNNPGLCAKNVMTRLKAKKAVDDARLRLDPLNRFPAVTLEALLQLFRTFFSIGDELLETPGRKNYDQHIVNLLRKTRKRNQLPICTTMPCRNAVVMLFYDACDVLTLGSNSCNCTHQASRMSTLIPSLGTHRRTLAYTKPRARQNPSI